MRNLVWLPRIICTTSSIIQVLYDRHGCIRRYDNVEEILREFFTLRMELYHKRKAYLEGILEAESSKLNNQARFIMEKIDGKVVIGEYTSGKGNSLSISWLLYSTEFLWLLIKRLKFKVACLFEPMCISMVFQRKNCLNILKAYFTSHGTNLL